MGPEKRESVDNILVTYTSSSETADNHIERRFEELRQEGFNNMVVATDDNVRTNSLPIFFAHLCPFVPIFTIFTT